MVYRDLPLVLVFYETGFHHLSEQCIIILYENVLTKFKS